MQRLNLNEVKYVKIIQQDGTIYCLFKDCCSTIGYGLLDSYEVNNVIKSIKKNVIFKIENNIFEYSFVKCD